MKKELCPLLIVGVIGFCDATAQIKVQVQGGSVVGTQKAPAQSVSSPQSSKKLANQDVIDLVSLKVSDDIIINTIRSAEVTEFDTSGAGLKILKEKNVSDAVVRAMMSPRAAVNAASIAKSSTAASSETSHEELSMAHGQSLPIKFRGAYIGQPVSDYVSCTSGKPVAPKGYRTHGDVCGRHGFIFHTQMKGVLTPKVSGEWLESEEGKIIHIKIMIPNEDWEKVRFDLTQKLGEPASEVPDVYQNGFGAHWEVSKGFWIKGDIVAIAGIRVVSTQGVPPGPSTSGIEIEIMSAERAKLPSTQPSTLD